MARQLLRRVLPLVILAAAIGLAIPASGLAGSGGDTILGASAPFPTGGGGGGGSGNYWWFEIKGYDVLPWSKYQTILDDFRNGTAYKGIPASQPLAYEAAIAEKMSSDCGNPGFFNATTDAQQGCALWQNYCPKSSLAKYFPNGVGVNIQGCSAFASSYDEFAAKYNGNSEVHTITYWGGTTTGKTIDLLIGWNVQIWREGHNAPIFERRIGLTTPNNDFDPPGISNHDWWYGGVGQSALWSSTDVSAGMLGAENTADNDDASCQTRFNASPTTFKYPAYTGNKTVPNQAHPPGSSWANWKGCYWSLGDGEALWLKWSVASPGQPVATLSYELQGKPGLFYAIHITAVDNREQLMTPFGTSAASFWNADNYFRIFVATPGPPPGGGGQCQPGDPPPCPQPPPEPKPSPKQVPPPQLKSQLQAQTPMPTRANSTQTVQTSPTDALDSGQALFPETVALEHFTPQMQYNGSTIATSDYTDSQYTIYDSMTSSEPTVPYPYPGPHGGPQLLDMAYLQQPAHLSPDEPDSITSSNDFQITWLHPTLNNPCSTGMASFTTPWPSNPSQCSDASSVRDAWDDTLLGQTTYEARWVGNGSKNTFGFISNQALRCNNPITTYGDNQYTDVSSCNDTFKLKSYTGPEYTTNAAQTQYAQGYFNVAHPVDAQHPDANGEAHIVLSGSAQGALSGRSVYTRPSVDNGDPAYDTPQQIDATHGNQPDSLTGKNELWYCKAGLPVGANIAHGSSALSGDSSVQNPSQTGDNGCRGYTVDWSWDSPGAGGTSDANVQDACSTTKNTPAPTAFHSPSINFMTAGEQGQANAWGLYSNYDGQHNPDGSSPMADIFQGNPTNWNTLLSETDGPTGQTVPTVPYTGLRPGAGSGYDHPGCAKSYGDGRYDAGQWSDTGNTDTQIIGYTADIPAVYDWVWNPCAYKQTVTTTKTVIKNGKKTTQKSQSQQCVGESEWTLITPEVPPQPIYKTYEIWSWSWSGPCYPSNGTEQAQTATPTKTISQQYYDGNAGGYVLPVHTQGDEQAIYDGASGQPHTVGGKDPELQNPITDMGSQTCGRQVAGHLQTGEWRFNSGPQAGFGTNQTGYRLPSNQYIASYQFSGPNIGGLTWSLTGSYDGYSGWKWYSKTMQNKPFSDAGNQAAVKVYGFRSTR